jgi:hypothetical protein
MIKYKIYFLVAMLFFPFGSVFADNLYVAYKWANPGDTAFTESWKIMDTPYSTDNAHGMQLLINELSELNNTKTVVIYYIRYLNDARENKSTDEYSGKIMI